MTTETVQRVWQELARQRDAGRRPEVTSILDAFDTVGEPVDPEPLWALLTRARVDFAEGVCPPSISSFVADLLQPEQHDDVLGHVAKPGPQYLHGPTTLRQILGEAGGLKGDTVTTIQITRGGEQINTTWEKVTRPGGDLPIYAGDQIYVPEGQAVYVLGAVNKPGALAYREGMTLYQAVSEAQGLGQYARINKVYILRDGQRIEVRLKRILNGQESDYILEPGDQIFIDER